MRTERSSEGGSRVGMPSITFTANHLSQAMHEKILKQLRELEDEILHAEGGYKCKVTIRSG